MNNMLFSKTMEDTRKRLDFRLTTRAKTGKKLIARPTFKIFDIINDDLTVIDLQENEVLMDKPLHLGLCILELYELTMYRCHYKEMIVKYGKKVKLACTDTDRVTYKMETEKPYIDLTLNLDAYDTSDYPSDHPLYSRTNVKVLGKFKDECASLVVQEYGVLGSKMYSTLLPAEKLNLQPREFHDVMC